MATTDRHSNSAHVARHTPEKSRLSNGSVDNATASRPRPQCTHTSMMRLYGKRACDSCGRVPSLGWLYLCVQDFAAYSARCQHDKHQSLSDSHDLNDDAHELEALGISSSVIAQLDAGGYTASQVALIKCQRRRVLETITETTSNSLQRTSVVTQDTDNSPRRELKELLPSIVSHRRMKSMWSADFCHYKCCHRCRPFLRDRLYTSFEAIWNGEEPPITTRELTNLHILGCNILKNMGRTPASLEYNNGANIQNQAFAPEPVLHPSRNLESKLDNTLSTTCAADPSLVSSTQPTSGPTSSARLEMSNFSISSVSLPTRLSTPYANDESSHKYPDMRKANTWRQLMHHRPASDNSSGRTSGASSILPNDTHAPVRRHSSSDSSSSSSYATTSYSGSSYDNEEGVDTSITHTEEAVETHLGDIAPAVSGLSTQP